jgi:O-antigen/teichoic acid export membrane protein
MSGALLNIVLNLIMIPKFGALGAAVATLASYGLVFLLRVLDVPRFIRFRLYLPRLLSNIALLLLSCVIMTARPQGWLWISIALTLAIVVLNSLSLIKNVRQMLYRRRRR